MNSFIWKPALKVAGLPQTRENGFHALRHHFASVLLYTHLMPNAADRMRAAVDHVLATGGANGPVTPKEGRYERSAW